MKIGNLIEQLRAERPASGADRARAATPAASGDAGVSPTDTVALSATSRNLSAREAGSASGDFDAEKVAAIRSAIEQGTFKVDAGRIADRLIEQTNELLNARSRS